jgi:hypothetical protein
LNRTIALHSTRVRAPAKEQAAFRIVGGNGWEMGFHLGLFWCMVGVARVGRKGEGLPEIKIDRAFAMEGLRLGFLPDAVARRA